MLVSALPLPVPPDFILMLLPESLVASMLPLPLSLIHDGHHQGLNPAAPTDHPLFNMALAQTSSL